MEFRWRCLRPDEPSEPFGVIRDLDEDDDDRSWTPQGLVIFRAVARVNPTRLPPLSGVKLMAAWNMIPRNQG